jgi:SAM-dependent methyltransferase
MPDYKDTVDYYESSYALHTNLSENTLLYERRRIARLPEQISLIGTLCQFLPVGSKILDIGCDRGFFLDEARRFGYEILGVEPSISAREACSKIGVPVRPSLTDIIEQFDCAVMWHSLEHFPKPSETIHHISDLLVQNGILAVRVPDFGSFWSRTLRHRWKWFQPHQHYIHYSVSSLGALLKQHGFEIVTLKSQRANTQETMRSHQSVNQMFAKNFGIKTTIRDYASLWYHYIASRELFCIARKL